MNTRFVLRLVVYVMVLIIAIYLLLQIPSQKSTSLITHIPIEVTYTPDTSLFSEALKYCQGKGFRTDFAVLIDLSKHSGNYRLQAIDLETSSVIFRGLVAHGHCKSTDNRFAQFSNDVGSNCSSVGKYKIGGKYEGNFGTSYKLIGLDSTNSNAIDRYIVLHSHPCIPDEPQEDDICLSEGCPTVSPTVLNKIIPRLDESKMPVLLWIY